MKERKGRGKNLHEGVLEELILDFKGNKEINFVGWEGD